VANPRARLLTWVSVVWFTASAKPIRAGYRLQPDKTWSPSLGCYPKGHQGSLRSGLRGPSLMGQG
jgi:hypothetical protein